jgi:hypothetical protein
VTITLCIDRNVNWKPGRATNRQGKRLRSARFWWLWVAVAWYAYDDRELAISPHEWEDG